MVKIEEQADWLVKDIGLEFLDDPSAMRICCEAGADVRETRVRADPAQIRGLCKLAPSEFTQFGRDTDRNDIIGGNNQVFVLFYGAPFVRDLEGGRRCGTLENVE